MCRARCASFYSSRLRNKVPAKASKQFGTCAVVTRWRSGATLCCRLRQFAIRRKTMKYICLGYYDKGKFDGMTESERNAMFDTCFEYDDHLRASGHWAGGE